jgi:hypothetical protein
MKLKASIYLWRRRKRQPMHKAVRQPSLPGKTSTIAEATDSEIEALARRMVERA